MFVSWAVHLYAVHLYGVKRCLRELMYWVVYFVYVWYDYMVSTL